MEKEENKRLPKIAAKKEEQSNVLLLKKASETDAFKHYVCSIYSKLSSRIDKCQDDCFNCPDKKFLNFRVTQEAIYHATSASSQQTVSNSFRGGDNGLEFLARVSYAAQVPIWELINLLGGFHFDNNGIVVKDLDNDKGGCFYYV